MICPLQSDWDGWKPKWWPVLVRWRDAVTCSSKLPDRFLLWVDAVGGYLVCLRDEVVLGQPVADASPDVPLLGDLSRRHAVIRRDADAYSIHALRPLTVDGRTVRHTAPLLEGSTIDLGEGVRLRFRRPHPLSATARLEFVSRHRTQPSTDAVLLMADTCLLGPAATCHVVAPHWRHDVVLFRQGQNLACRSATRIMVDGATRRGRATLQNRSHVEGEEFAFSLEPLATSDQHPQ